MEDSELDDYQKGTSSEQTRTAIDFLHSFDIKVRANFIVRPEYGRDQFRRLAEFVQELGVDYPSFSVLTPLPGTLLYEETRHRLISNDPDLFDCYHTLFPTVLPPEEFYFELANLLSSTAQRRSRAGEDVTKTERSHPMFYYSDEDAFGQMIAAVKRGHERGHMRVEGAPRIPTKRVIPLKSEAI